MEKRKSGFYWVRTLYLQEWIIMWYGSKSELWFSYGHGNSLKDLDMASINENRIMSPDEWE